MSEQQRKKSYKSESQLPTNQPTKFKLWKALIKLSRRESEVLQKVAEGKINGEIGEELHISPRTVENTRARICEKFGLKGKGALHDWIKENWPE